MALELRANTAVDVLIGPFVDDGDGDTADTDATLVVELSKNGQALATKNEGTNPSHDAAGTVDGYYNCQLDTTDTNTEGNLVLVVHHADDLPVRHEYSVLAEAAWDSKYVAKDDGFMDVNVKTIGRSDTQETEANNLESACSNYSVTRGLTGTAVPAAVADAAGGLIISDDGGVDVDELYDGIVTDAQGTNVAEDVALLVGTDGKALISTDAQDLSATLDVNTKLIEGADPTDTIRDSIVDDATRIDASSVNAVEAKVDAVPTAVEIQAEMEENGASVLDTIRDQIGTAGAGLSAVPWNANWDAEVESEVTDSLIAHNLDHLCKTATGAADMTTEVVDNSILSRVFANGDTSAFVPSTDGLQLIRDKLTDIENDTNELQTDDVPGLIAALNDVSTAEVNAEVDTALADVNLDHVVGTAAGIPAVPAGTYLDQLSDDGTAVFDRTTDSLQAIRDRGDAAWTTGGGGSITDMLNVIPLIPESIDLASTATWRLGLMLTNALNDLPSTAEITPGTIDIDRKAAAGSSWSSVVSGASCSESAGMIYYDEVFDALAGYAVGDSIRVTFKSQKITVAANDYVITDATGRIFYTEIRPTATYGLVWAINTALIALGTRIPAALVSGRMSSDAEAISGATAAADNLEANIGNLDAAVSGVENDTQDIQSRIPAALISGRMSADAVAISGSTDAADKLEASAETVVTGAAAAGTLSTTQMTTDLTEATNDHYNGRIVIWTSGVLKDQASDITDYDGATKMVTFTAVTEAPSATDTFVIV